MALTTLTALIENLDGFELIRQQIGALLVIERDNQKALATEQSKDPKQWDFKVYEERSTAYEGALNKPFDLTPVVNVWFDSDTFDEKSSTRAEKQKCIGSYNIDVCGFAKAVGTAEGHMPADKAAALEAHRAARLVRNILMSSVNTYLQLPRGTAWDRRVQSRQSYQPNQGENPIVSVVALRLRFQVSFNEYGPQYEGVPLANLVAAINRTETGELYTTLNYA